MVIVPGMLKIILYIYREKTLYLSIVSNKLFVDNAKPNKLIRCLPVKIQRQWVDLIKEAGFIFFAPDLDGLVNEVFAFPIVVADVDFIV